MGSGKASGDPRQARAAAGIDAGAAGGGILPLNIPEEENLWGGALGRRLCGQLTPPLRWTPASVWQSNFTPHMPNFPELF